MKLSFPFDIVGQVLSAGTAWLLYIFTSEYLLQIWKQPAGDYSRNSRCMSATFLYINRLFSLAMAFQVKT